MANINDPQSQGQGQRTQGQQVGGGQQVGSPVSNEAFNVIACLHKKLEGLEALRKYSMDGNQQLWKKISDEDVRVVQLLIDELEQLVQGGKFRLGTPGQSTGKKPTA